MMEKRWFLLALLPVTLVFFAFYWSPAPYEQRLAEFTTSLEGRTPGQRHNAEWAIKRLRGVVLQPGQTFSFNRRVGPWGRREGVVRAPVSYGGILVPSWGGGICQVSTTLYCAALLAGMEIVERHAHAVCPAYIPAGMDAAVAYGLADLKIRNPYPFPVAFQGEIVGNHLICRIMALSAQPIKRGTCRLVREWIASQPPPAIKGLKPQPGRAGVRVRLWRIVEQQVATKRELCHETEYAPLPQGKGDR